VQHGKPVRMITRGLLLEDDDAESSLEEEDLDDGDEDDVCLGFRRASISAEAWRSPGTTRCFIPRPPASVVMRSSILVMEVMMEGGSDVMVVVMVVWRGGRIVLR